jgi:hypothetical protein
MVGCSMQWSKPHPHPNLYLPLAIEIRRIHIQWLSEGGIGEAGRGVDLEASEEVQRRRGRGSA